MSAFHIDILYTFFMFLVYLLALNSCLLMLLWLFILKYAGKQVLGVKE